eukprot:3265874-Ditylum_brightwellii.AAC.1
MFSFSLPWHQEEYYLAISSLRTSTKWASDLCFGLLQIPQKCWLKRNRLIYSHSEDYVSNEVYTKLSVRICGEFAQGHEGVASGDQYLWEFSVDKVLAMNVPDRQAWLHLVLLACNG